MANVMRFGGAPAKAEKETWLLNAAIYSSDIPSSGEYSVKFMSNNTEYNAISFSDKSASAGANIKYGGSSVIAFISGMPGSWKYPAYRKVVFDEPVTGDLLTILTAIGKKQSSETLIENSKTIYVYPGATGAKTVTPSVPYDAMAKATLTQDAKTVALSMASGDQVVNPDSSSKILSRVTITKPDTLVEENIKSGVNIGGVIGTYTGTGTGGVAYGSVTIVNASTKAQMWVYAVGQNGWIQQVISNGSMTLENVQMLTPISVTPMLYSDGTENQEVKIPLILTADKTFSKQDSETFQMAICSYAFAVQKDNTTVTISDM